MSPRSDILRGWKKYRWLLQQRREDREVDPSLRIQGELTGLEKRLQIAQAAQIDRGCIFWMGGSRGNIALGQNTYIGPYSFIGTQDESLVIGNNSMIGAQSYITTVNHRTDSPTVPYREQGFVGKPIKIGENVWIGCQVFCLPCVSIGDHAVIGAGAVVTKDVPAEETWCGVPACSIRH